ncbi:MAG: UDP-glucose 6-dehydrogenase [Candidatus Saccharibacteria bacterium]|nr:UDP-glucose 6-dehydrogenase [Candidatus Saccharibacteria bacterium]
MYENPVITVLGAGYVGLTTAALLAHSGYTVYAVEPNASRLNAIKRGKSFFYEKGLDPIIESALDSGTLIPTDSYEMGIPKSDVIFSCVGTPDNPDGSSNLTYVFNAAKEAARYLKPGSIYIQKSTVPVGTGADIEKLFTKLNKQIDYVSNPEFLREGTALQDTLFFDRIVVGGNNKQATDTVLSIYRNLEACRETIATKADVTSGSRKGEYITTSLNSAELIKVTANAFLALKISFANSIAKLADTVGADVVDVMNAVGADERIGSSFLHAGRGYGGGCFPKDVSGLIASGHQHGVELEIMTAARAVNDSMPGYIIKKLQNKLGDSLKNKQITVLGLAFKAGTSDVRRSPGVAIANALQRTGAIVRTYDPQVQDEAADDYVDGIMQQTSLEAAIKGADIVVITTEWLEFTTYHAANYAKLMKGSLLFDAVNCLDIPSVQAAGLTYVGVGR